MSDKKVIFLVDMNSFFVSCELLRRPEYKKKPLVIATMGKRSVISAASYKAKEMGVDSASNLQQTLMRYPDMIVVPPDFDYYRLCSKKIMQFLRQFSESVLISSIDEAYLDVTHYFNEVEPTTDNICKLARHIQGTLLKQLGFPSNIGISTNKFLAKMASELRKPFAIETLYVEEIPDKLWPLPIGSMHGVGKKTAEMLKYLNIQTIGEFASFSNEQLLESLLGPHILRQRRIAQGVYSESDESVEERKERLSVSQSRTFSEDVNSLITLEKKLDELWCGVVEELTKKQKKFRTLRVFYKRSDFQTIQRSETLPDYTDDFDGVLKEAKRLLSELWDGEDVRLIGIGVTDFIEKQQHAEQLNLFQMDENARQKSIQMMRKESILKKFGKQYNLMTGDVFAQKKKQDQIDGQIQNKKTNTAIIDEQNNNNNN